MARPKEKEEEKSVDLDSLIPKFGDLSKSKARQSIEVIPTGSFSLNRALGVGGYPRGRIIEIFGPESSGKTTLALLACAEVQKAGGIAAYIDVEHALSIDWAQKLGVDTDELRFDQPDYGEQALELVEKIVESNKVDLVVVDSTAALIPKVELEAELEKDFVGTQARLMSKALRRLSTVVGKSRCVVIFINQLRNKIGVMYGDPTTTPGGLALKFYCSVRLAVSALSGKENVYTDSDDNRIGHRLKVNVKKNKVAAPFKICEFDLYFTSGVDNTGEIIELSVETGVVIQAGKMYSFGDKKWNGWDAFGKAVREDPALYDEIKAAVLNAH